MFVHSLDLINIRSFQGHQNIQFSPSINLLVGNNNSGKSTIIKALFKLQNIHTLSTEDIRKPEDIGHVIIELADVEDDEKEVFRQSIAKQETNHVLPDGIIFNVFFQIAPGRTGSIRVSESFFVDGQFLKFSLEKSQAINITNTKGISSYKIPFTGLPNNEKHNNFIYPFFANRKTRYYNRGIGIKEAYEVSEDLTNITAKIAKLSNSSHPKNKRFNQLTKEILGFEIGVIPLTENESTIGIFINDGETIPINSMGEGVVNILGLIVVLLTEDRKLYLIEEIENDIHPKALKKLLELILDKSSNNQFVISTHSNIVVKYLGASTSKIFHLTWQPYKNVEEDRLPTTSIKPINNTPEERMDLLTDLGYDVQDFDLYKSYLIFEESSAEELIRNFIIPNFVPKLKDKIRTLAANGADDLKARFSDFLRLFVFIHQAEIYHSKAWVIADGDKAGRENIDELKKKFSKWDEEHFINLTKENIEEYYPERFQSRFASIKTTSDKKEKRNKKIELTKFVKEWITKNPEKAKEEFATSAKEMIDLLKKIEKKIK